MADETGGAAPGTQLQTEDTTDVIGYRLRRAQLSVFKNFIAAFEAFDLRPAEYSVLVLIAKNPGRKQTEFAEVLGIKRANFVTLINRLEKRGLTERRIAAGDRRANALHLTPAGVAFVARIRKTQDAFESQYIEKVGGIEQRDALFSLLDRLLD